MNNKEKALTIYLILSTLFAIGGVVYTAQGLADSLSVKKAVWKNGFTENATTTAASIACYKKTKYHQLSEFNATTGDCYVASFKKI